LPIHRLVLAVYLPTLILSICTGLLLPILPVYVSTFEVGLGLVGLVLAGEAIGMLMMDIPAGRLLVQLDRKWLMIAGIVLLASSVLMLSWTQTIWQVLVCRLVAGGGAAIWNISRHAYITEVTKRQARGRAIALFGGTNRLGIFIGPVIGGAVAARFGFSAVFYLYSGLAISAIVVAWLCVERGADVSVAAPNPLSLWGIVRTHRKVLLAAGAGQLLVQMIRAARQVIIPLYGTAMGLEVDAIGLIMSVSSLVDMSLFYPAGVVMDRLGRKFAVIPSFMLQGVGMALIPLADSFVPLLVAACVIGVGNGLSAGTMMTIGSDLAPKDNIGKFLGLWRLIGDGGSVGGPVIVGAVAQVLALSSAALVMAGVGWLAALIFARFVPETLHSRLKRSL
jgi:MFS family permease